MILRKPIVYFGQAAAIVCDARCDKAWGKHNRPHLSVDLCGNKTAFLDDDECGIAPVDPGTYEGDYAKPLVASVDAMNKWCARECERSAIVERDEIPRLPDFSRRAVSETGTEVKQAHSYDGVLITTTDKR